MIFHPRTLLAAAVLAALGLIAPGAASACEDEERPVPCRLEQACSGNAAPLCGRVAKAFCAQPGRCTDPATLTMDPRRCVALNAQIRAARKAPSPTPAH